MLLTGLAGGVIAGLLGVGGGIVVVPVLDVTLSVLRVDPAIRMHVAVATSQATIVLTSISSSRAHFRRDSVNVPLVKRWALFLLLGALAGVVVADHVHGRVLSIVFAVVALLVAVKMMLPLDHHALAQEAPHGVPGAILPGAIGTLSSMMGIGGGTLSVPIMTLLNEPIHRAVGTASVFGFIISVPATIGFIIAGWGNADLPAGNLGFVNLLGFALIAPATVLTAPLGARLAHWLPRRYLSFVFGGFLFIVSARMFWESMR